MRIDRPPRLLTPALLLALLPATACLANPIIVAPGQAIMEGALIGCGINLVVDGIVLALAYLILRKGHAIRSWTFLKHWLWVFLAGTAIDLFIYGAAGGLITSGPGVLLIAAMGLAALGATNYIIAAKRPGFSSLQALVVAALIGIVTNPILVELVLKAIGFQIDLMARSSSAL